jgi:GDP-L-fucose synthase
MSFWENKKVLVTGGAGFVGSHVVEMLVQKNAVVRVADNLENSDTSNLVNVKEHFEFLSTDLRDPDGCQMAVDGMDVVLNVAARVGGVSYNSARPASMFRDNMLIGLNVLEAARIHGVERFLAVSSACVYSRDCTIPMRESDGFVGVPERSNEGYGWAKRMAEVQARAYAEEWNMKVAIARPFNSYGPRDQFDTERSHVIPSIIRRTYGGEDPLDVWGDGKQKRSFLYVTDFARGLLELIEKYPVPDPINLGSDEEIGIGDLAAMIVRISGKSPAIRFDSTKPSGQPRRNCDSTKAKEKIGFKAKVGLEEGLTRTMEWYRRSSSGERV